MTTVEITEILADLLSEELRSRKAGSAEEALLHLQEMEFQLVISDITMPGMSGLGHDSSRQEYLAQHGGGDDQRNADCRERNRRSASGRLRLPDEALRSASG